MRFVLVRAMWQVALRFVYVNCDNIIVCVMKWGLHVAHLLCFSGCTLMRLLHRCLLVKTLYHALIVLVRLHP
jgi:hypothetical protein